LRGLRIRVRDVLDLLAAGATREQILTDYPLLEAGDISAALEYAALAAVSSPAKAGDPVTRDVAAYWVPRLRGE
jgi:uncharacterized protein (DUF433 family)